MTDTFKQQAAHLGDDELLILVAWLNDVEAVSITFKDSDEPLLVEDLREEAVRRYAAKIGKAAE